MQRSSTSHFFKSTKKDRQAGLFVFVKSIQLLGVQFDDVGFVDFVLVWEFVSLWETNQGSGPVIERFFDVWKIESLSFLEGLFEHFVGSVSFTQGNDLASA